MAIPVAAAAPTLASTILQWLPAVATTAAAGSELYKNLSGGDQMKKTPTMDKQQQSLLNQIIKMLSMQGSLGKGHGEGVNYLRDLMDPSSQAVQQFTDPYMRQFEQQIVPGLAEKFAGMGAMGGGLSSSGFGQALGAAGGNLQSLLAALKAGLGQQAAGQLMGQYAGLSGLGLGASPFGYQAPQQGFGGGFLGSLSQGYGQQLGKQWAGG